MKIIKTILIGCAWCKKVIGVESHDSHEGDDLAIISHGMCEECSDQIMSEMDLESEEESEDEEEKTPEMA